MATPKHNIESEALSLPLEGRARLAVKLLDSIEHRSSVDPKRIERAWLEEANRRYEAFVRGEMEAIPAEQVFAELRDEVR